MTTATLEKKSNRRRANKNVAPITTIDVTPAASVTVEKVSRKSELPKDTVEHLNPAVSDSTVPSNWRDMQALAKQFGIKAGGKGVNSSTLNHALCEYKRLGRDEFASKYPEFMPKTVSKSTKSEKLVNGKIVTEERILPECLKGMSFREAQAHVKHIREQQIKRGHKGKFADYIKTYNVAGEIRDCKSTSWGGLVNQLEAIARYVETKM